jgi:hypothetical protein
MTARNRLKGTRIIPARIKGAAALLAAMLSAGAASTGAQSLQNQVLSLYPRATGELVFVDLRGMRGTPHYARIKQQVLPDRFRTLEQWVAALGVDFDREIRQLSWAFTSDQSGIGFVGVAEGDYSLSEVESEARRLKLAVARPGGTMLVTLGKNEQGSEFVFAFLDRSTALFGVRSAVQEILDRRAQGGPSLLDNAALSGLITPLNGKVPVWIVLDRKFSALSFKQMLPDASQVPGFDQVADRVNSTTLRFELKNGLQSQAVVQCRDSQDALVLSTAAQAAFAFQSMQLQEKNPELARALSQIRINRSDTRLDLDWNIPESDFHTLLAKNGLALKF